VRGKLKVPAEEIALDAEELVRTLCQAARLELAVETTVQEQEVRVDLSGPDSELLLADNARLLYALNHLTHQVFFRRSREGPTFLLDCKGYRGTRALELELLARKAAEKVRSSHTPVSFQPMPASERRIIHLALAGDTSVRTESEGTGQRRRVLILPS
jgi:spoIIIJ-associated protein